MHSSLSLSHTHSHEHILSYISHTHTHTHSLSLSLSFFLSRTTHISLSLSHSHPHFLAFIYTHSLFHTHTHTHTHKHILCLCLSFWICCLYCETSIWFSLWSSFCSSYTRCIRYVSRLFSYGHLKLSKTLENSLCYCYTSCQMTDFSFKWTATAGIGIHPTKAWLSQLVNFKNLTL